MKESALQREIRLHLGQKSDLVIWRNNTGTMRMGAMVSIQDVRRVLVEGVEALRRWLLTQEKDERFVRFGLVPGSSDLLGILRPSGRWFCLEIKAKGKKPTEEQLLFMQLINDSGGYAAWADSVAVAEMHYQNAIAGLRGA